MSQEQLSVLLGISRSRVAQMESNGEKISYETRRELVKILGTSALAFGLASAAGLEVKTIYNYDLLKLPLLLFREQYFSGNVFGGMTEIDKAIVNVFELSKGSDHSDKKVLELLIHYYQLGIDIAREERSPLANSYAESALSIARTLNDAELYATTLMRYNSSLLESGQLEKARSKTDELLTYLNKVPPIVSGSMAISALKSFAENKNSRALDLANQGLKIAHENKKSVEDRCFLRLTVPFAESRMAYAMICTGKAREALSILDKAEDKTDLKHSRRMATIKLLKAEAHLKAGKLDNAADELYYSLDFSGSISSKSNRRRQQTAVDQLSSSKIGKTPIVAQLRKLL